MSEYQLPQPLTEDVNSRILFLLECEKMKSILRRTMLADYSRRENDAEHSWHLALTALTMEPYAAEKVDMKEVLSMACVHDLVEVYAGDTFAYDVAGYADKDEREENAARKLFAQLPDEQGKEFYDLWKTFEKCETPSSRFTNACDRVQPFINNVVTCGHTWRINTVYVSQVKKRMAVVYEVLPALSQFIDNAIKNAVEKGWLIED